MKPVFQHFVSVAFSIIMYGSSAAVGQGSFHCKMKAGCNFPQCDPIPGALNKFGFKLDDYLQVKEFPILCEARGQEGIVNVVPEIVNDNKEIDALKQELHHVKAVNKEQSEDFVILKYEHRQTKNELKSIQQISNKQAEELNELRVENTRTLRRLEEQNKELKKLQENIQTLMKADRPSSSKPTAKPSRKAKTPAESEGAVRIVGGRHNKEGIVEIFHAGKWGSICAHGWGMDAANSLCLALGFDGAKFAFGGARFGRGSGNSWIHGGHTCDEDNMDFYLCRGPFTDDYHCVENVASVVCN